MTSEYLHSSHLQNSSFFFGAYKINFLPNARSCALYLHYFRQIRAEQLGRQNLICMAACSKITKNSFLEMQELLHAQECAIYARIGCFGLLPHPFKIVGAVHRRRLAGWHCRRIFFHTIFVVPIDQLTVAHSCSNFLAHHTQIMRHIH